MAYYLRLRGGVGVARRRAQRAVVAPSWPLATRSRYQRAATGRLLAD